MGGDERKASLTSKMSDHEVRIGQLNLEKAELKDVIEGARVKIRECEQAINKRDNMIT
jgi:hypothetical protein